jgi:RNA polymerase sigma factor (sigma-70 family)
VVVVVSPAGPASPAAAAVNAPSPANGNAQPGPSHIPVVTPTVTSLLGSVDASSPVPPGDAFRVQRAPAPGPQLEVYYTLRSYEGTETVLRTGTLSFPDDAGHVDLPADGAAGSRGTPEILVLTLRPDQGYRVGKRSVTMFRGAGPACADEGVLLKAYQEAQSEEAFRALVERHRSTVYQTCRQLLGNSHDAEDVTQLVFLALAQRQVFLQTTLVRWLRKVARNAALMLLRSRGRRARHERKAARVDAAVADSHELTEELNAALALMSAPLREAVRLRYLEDRSQNEAADIAGCPRGTLSQRAAKGVRSLRDILLGRGTVV